jgi:hypothetical protein
MIGGRLHDQRDWSPVLEEIIEQLTIVHPAGLDFDKLVPSLKLSEPVT